MHTAIKINTAKIISGILATILSAVIVRIIVPAIWFWIGFEIVAALLVAIGCAGEWYLHNHPAGRKKVEKEEHHRLESKFILAVVIGVFMEFCALGHVIPASISLENDLVFEKLEVEKLRQKNNQFETRLLYDEAPRSVRFISQRSNFIALLKDKPVAEVEFMYVPGDEEGMEYCLAIAGALQDAGWTLIGGPEPIPDDKVADVLKTLPVETLKKMPPVIRATGSSSEITVRAKPGTAAGTALDDALMSLATIKPIGFSFGIDNSVPTNRILVVIGSRP